MHVSFKEISCSYVVLMHFLDSDLGTQRATTKGGEQEDYDHKAG